MKLAQCHPNQKHWAKGLCTTCYRKKYHVLNGDKRRAYALNYWYSNTKNNPTRLAQCRERSKQWRLKHPERYRALVDAWHLKKRYGITIEEYRKVFESNNGLCWICGNRPAAHIDHCHDTGKVRGALCKQCNMGIGLFGDDADLLLKAVQYLQTESFEKIKHVKRKRKHELVEQN